MIEIRRFVACSALLVAGLFAGGCPGGPTAKVGGPVKLSMKRRGGNSFLAGQFKSKESSNAVQIVQRDLRPPFRVEVTTGIFHPKRQPADYAGMIFGMELDAPGGAFPPPEFYFVSMQFLANDASVWSGSKISAPNRVAETVFPGVTRVDMAIEHDGTDVMYFARPAGTRPWTALGSETTTGRPFPVHPTIGMFFGRKPLEVGFDNFRVLSNGERPGGLSARESIIEDLWDVLDLQTDVGHKLDDAAIEPSTLAAALETAAVLLDGIDMDLEALTLPGKKNRKTVEEIALKNLRKGIKQLTVAQSKLEKGKSRTSIGKKVEKALRLQFQALYGLQQDL